MINPPEKGAPPCNEKLQRYTKRPKRGEASQAKGADRSTESRESDASGIARSLPVAREFASWAINPAIWRDVANIIGPRRANVSEDYAED